MKVGVLVENTKDKLNIKVEEEHGISLYIESGEEKLLFDTGASDKFYKNAKAMGINLGEISKLVISHHHYDHGGGLKCFLENNNLAEIYCKECTTKNFSGIFGVFHKYIGLDNKLLMNNNYRVRYIDDFKQIGNKIFLIGKISDEKYKKPYCNSTLFIKDEEGYKEDNFFHELILVIKEADGLVVFTGCAHNGVLNMVETVEQHFKGETIKVLIGGFHLMNPTTKETEMEQEIVNIGKILKENANIKSIYTGHCTGEKPYNILKDILGDKLNKFSTGEWYYI